MHKNKLTRIWVDPKFKIKIQKIALDKNMSLAKYTSVLSGLDDPLQDLKPKKRGKYEFTF